MAIKNDQRPEQTGSRIEAALDQRAAVMELVESLSRAERRAGPNIELPAQGMPSMEDLASLGLTLRQAEVLLLLADGLANKEIARKLNVSEWTVRHHVSSILERLEVTNRVRAATIARQLVQRQTWICAALRPGSLALAARSRMLICGPLLQRHAGQSCYSSAKIAQCPSGEIGRHSGLKIRRLPERGRTGSIPVSGTRYNFGDLTLNATHRVITGFSGRFQLSTNPQKPTKNHLFHLREIYAVITQMAVFRKGAKRWRAEIYVEGQREPRTFVTNAQVQAWAAKRETERRQQAATGITTCKTLQDAFDRYERGGERAKHGHRWEALRMAAMGAFLIEGIKFGQPTRPT